MPEKNLTWLKHEDILSFEEIFQIIKRAVPLGISKIRLTGGEPLIRRNIVKLVAMISSINGIKDFAMTTNGILLSQYAQRLKNAGLHRVNISLDTLDAKKFYKLTRGGNIKDVLKGIQSAQQADLTPIKLNCVLNGCNNKQELQNFARQNNLMIRFIHLMDLKAGKFSQIEGGSGGDCANCNRLRLLSDGTIRPCLFSDIGFNVRKLGIEEAIKKAIKYKPKQGAPCNHEWIQDSKA